MIYKSIKHVWIFGLFLMFSNSIFSQEEIDIEKLIELPIEDLWNIEVISASRFEEKALEAPASIIVISAEEIKDKGYRDLSDVLKNIGGIDIIDNASRFGEFYSIRGIQGNDRFLILLNGVKINPPGGTFLSIGNSVSLSFIDRVEIVFGPSSAIYGADAFSGIINIITKQSNSEGFKIQIQKGSSNLFDVGTEAEYKLNNDLSLQFFGRYFYSDGPDFAGRSSIYNIFNRYKAPLAEKMEQPIKDHNIYLSLSYKNFHLDYFRKYFNEGNGLGHNPDLYFLTKDNFWESSTDLINLRFTDNINEGDLTVRTKYLRSSLGSDSKFVKLLVAGDPDKNFIQYMTGKDVSFGVDVTYNKVITENLKYVAGCEIEFISSIPPYANDQVLGNSYKYEGINKTLIDDQLTVNQNRYAGFLQLTYSPHKNLKFMVGGRADYFSRYDFSFNPRLGLIYTPQSETVIKLLFGTAFQAPSLFYEFEQFGTPVQTMLSVEEIRKNFQADWNLDNQKLTTYELGVNHKISSNIYFSASLYYNHLFNMIERVNFSNSVYNKYFNTYTSAVRNENIGEEDIFGLDLNIRAFSGSNSEISLFYSFIDAYSETNKEREAIPRIAKHKLWISATFKDLFGFLTVSPRLQLVGDISNVNKTAYPNGRQDGYLNFDVYFLIKDIIKNLNGNIVIENVFNSFNDYPGLFRQSAVYVPVIPMNIRQIKAGLELSF